MATFTLTGDFEALVPGGTRRVTMVEIRPSVPIRNPVTNVTFEPRTRVSIPDEGNFSIALPSDHIPSGYGFVVSAPQVKLQWYVPSQVADATVDLSDFAATGLPELVTPAALSTVAAAAAAAELARDQAVAVGNTNDTIIAGRVNTPGSATRVALDARYTTPTSMAGVYAKERVRNIVDFGATPASAAAAIQAAHDDIPVGEGGVIVIPSGDWQCNATINITRECEIRGAGGSTEYSSTALVFASGVKGMNVQLPDSGATFRISGVTLNSLAAAYNAGKYGIHIKQGRVIAEAVSVYHFGDHGWFFDTTTVPNNCNHGMLTLIRAYGNYGDGIRIDGPDSNALTFINPDVVANYGWGINNIARHNLFIHPHADHGYNGSPGAYRDNGMSNRWEMVYSEGGYGTFQIDTASLYGYFSTSAFGLCPITKVGTGHTTWEIERNAGARERVRSTNGVKDFVQGVGLIGTNSYDIINATDNAYISSAAADGSEVSLYGHQYPAVTGTKDLGWSGRTWRRAYINEIVLGGLFLRNNGGVLEKSTNGTTWSAV